jgi:hypothetical protein
MGYTDHGERDMSAPQTRAFSREQFIQTVRELLARQPQIQRTALSRQVCETLNWRGANGSLSEVSCRVMMLRLAEKGLITLPPSRLRKQRRRAHFPPTEATDPEPVLQVPVHQLPRPTLQVVKGQKGESRRWNEYIARYHYLGYTPLSGNQMRYNVYAGDRLVALIAFGASAWKLAAREQFIGWGDEQRERNLPLIVNNTRFLILPWIQSKGLASKVLGLTAKQLPVDWLQRYGYQPVLLETFVESPRHAGTCYKAANWKCIGKTAGRGKKSMTHRQHLPTKDIWIYPLRRDFKSTLCG